MAVLASYAAGARELVFITQLSLLSKLRASKDAGMRMITGLATYGIRKTESGYACMSRL